ncbi:MAG: type secretion system protein PulO [Nitrospirae bacterium]|nr:type secretion system protein PulO [Nitrospirota bacterium]
MVSPDPLRTLIGNPATKRLRVLAAVCAGLIVLNLLLYAFTVVPAAARLAASRQQYADLKREYAEAALFQKQKQLFAGLMSGIPAQKDVPLLIKDLAQTARRLNLSVDAINSDIPTQGTGGLTMLTFTFPAAGSYPDVKRFIYQVETSSRLVGIQDLKLGSEKGRVKLQMKLVTYIRGE